MDEVVLTRLASRLTRDEPSRTSYYAVKLAKG
jgi:hypothetical protein